MHETANAAAIALSRHYGVTPLPSQYLDSERIATPCNLNPSASGHFHRTLTGTVIKNDKLIQNVHIPAAMIRSFERAEQRCDSDPYYVISVNFPENAPYEQSPKYFRAQVADYARRYQLTAEFPKKSAGHPEIAFKVNRGRNVTFRFDVDETTRRAAEQAESASDTDE
jgi:hypothetical protein